MHFFFGESRFSGQVNLNKIQRKESPTLKKMFAGKIDISRPQPGVSFKIRWFQGKAVLWGMAYIGH